MSAPTTNAIDRRYEFILLYDVINGNPNGDPDAGNAPRIDPETGHGLVSDVCLKRKIRDFVTLAKRDAATGQPADGYDIYVKHHGVLLHEHEKAFHAVGLGEAKGKERMSQSHLARDWMCRTYYDIRAFGAVLSVGQKKELNCGQVRGPVQIAFSRSIDRITSLGQALTRVAVTTPEKAEKQLEEKGAVYSEMGRKEIVPYALYEAHGFISPHLAADTGFTGDDLSLLWQSLTMMFEHDHSASRGEMAARRLIVFEHESALGNAPAHALFRRLSISRKDESRPARAYEDYDVALDTEGMPKGVSVKDIL